MDKLIAIVRELLDASGIHPNRKGELHDVLTDVAKGATDVAEVADAAAAEVPAAAPAPDGTPAV